MWSLLGLQSGQIQGMNHHEKDDNLTIDHDLASVTANHHDALVLPGGVANPDTLHVDEKAVAFVRHFAESRSRSRLFALAHGL